jgi:hypothetical protein
MHNVALILRRLQCLNIDQTRNVFKITTTTVVERKITFACNNDSSKNLAFFRWVNARFRLVNIIGVVGKVIMPNIEASVYETLW